MSKLSPESTLRLMIIRKVVEQAALHANKLMEELEGNTSIRAAELGRVAHRLNECFSILASDKVIHRDEHS